MDQLFAPPGHNAVHLFVVDPSDPVRERLAEVFGADQPWIGHEDLAGLARAVDDGAAPAVAVVGPGIDHDDTLVLADSAREEATPLAIVKVAKVVEPDHLRSALRVGIEDVVEDEVELARLVEAVERSRGVAVQRATPPAAPMAADEPATAPVVAVVAGKGGVGATLVTANLASALADLGVAPVVVDLDVTGGDVAIMFQHRPSLTLGDALARVEHLDVNALDGYLGTVGDVRILAAPLVGEDLPVDPTALHQVLDLAGQMGDVVLVDVGSTFRPAAQHVLGMAARVLVVTTMEVPAIRGTRRVLGDLAHRATAPDQVVVVANGVGSGSGLAVSDATKALETSVDVEIPWDKHAARSVNQGEHLVAMRRSKAGKAINRAAGELAAALKLG